MAGEKGDMTKTSIGVLFEDLLEEILTRLPLKPLTRLMCASKGWYHFIDHLQRSRPRTSKSGLFIHYSGTLVALHDLKANDRTVDCTQRAVFTLEDGCRIVGSTNGLLLCCNMEGENYLCNPNLNQRLVLPSYEEFSRFPFQGITLAFDGSPHHHYKVVCFSTDSHTEGYLDCLIYSSETGKWIKKCAKLWNYLLTDGFYADIGFQSLFRRRAIYWVHDGHMLIYNLEENFFKIKVLPSKKLDVLPCKNYYDLQECLWDSDGLLHYCHLLREYSYKLHIGVHLEGDIPSVAKSHMNVLGKWQLKYKLDGLTFGGQVIPCGFNEDLRIFIFRNAENIYSYRFENQSLNKLHAYKTPEYFNFSVYPIHFSSVDLSFGGPNKSQMPEKESSQSTGRA